MSRGRPAIHVLLLAFAVLLALSSAGADETHIIQLKHRPANEVMPLIRPLLGPDDALSGMDFRLIIRTSDRNLKEVERILMQVDVARQRLRITVEQASVEDRATTSQSVTGEARIGDKARVTLPAKPPQKGGLVVQKDGLRYTANRRTTAASNTNTQTVITLDGQRAYIRIGQSVPHVKKILALSRRQLVLIQDIELQDVTTGFDVLPRMRGDRVLVEITPRLSSLRNPATGLADFQELSTTVETKLGEWLDLGEILGNRGEVERAILESASTTSDERRTVRLKIE
jgi:type II secretory pathway component GspD/PulD (secretin)